MIKKFILAMISIIVLLAGAAAGVYLVQKRQSLEQQAAVPSGTADMALSPANSNTLKVGDAFSVNVTFQSPSEPVSGVSVKIDYTYTGAEPVLNPISITENQSLNQTYHWNYRNKDYACANGTCTITIIAFQTGAGGYSSPGETTLATIGFSVVSEGTANLTFDAAETMITSSNTGDDILSVSSLTGPWTYSSGTVVLPSATPTATVTQGAIPSATPTATPTGTGPGNNVCNLACNSNSDCGGGLICQSNQCRNSTCPSDSDCNCNNNPSPTPTTKVAGPTNTPRPVTTSTAAEPALPQSGTTENTLLLIGFGLMVMLGGAVLAARQ